MRPASIANIEVYFDALLDLADRSPCAKMSMVEPDAAYESLQGFINTGRAYEVGDYLILFDYGPTWYSRKLHFIEELVIRFQKRHRNPVEDAVRAIEKLARGMYASAIVVGDTQTGLMTEYYKADGYKPIGTQLFKELSYGVPAEDHGAARTD